MSAAEIFDVVDAHDRVTGQAPRDQVHREGLRHRAAHVVVCDPDGRVYLQRRALSKDCSPGLWDTSASGHVLAGEDYDACARRELTEELGLTGFDLSPCLFKLPAHPDTGNEFVCVYRVTTTATIRPDPAEISAGDWYVPAAIDAWLAARPDELTATFRQLWARLQRVGPPPA